jgi:signal transduction histidine kinase
MPNLNLSPTPPADLETIQSRLRELDELKAAFVALVSHELRAPVGLLNGYLDVGLSLMENGSDVTEAKEYFLTAKKHSAQLIRIVQELTDFARVQQNDIAKLSDPFTLRDCLIQVFTLLRPIFESKSIKPVIEIPPHLAANQYDGESLILISRNLLSNAVKFTPQGGRVAVAASSAGRAITLSIHDNAAPIPPDKHELIFDDFRQIENYLTRRYEGMGLGLAVARRTARALGGDITLHVRADGNTFVVTLPHSPS